ncbi:MAG: hypothetical protein D6714_08070 [Bacteroidetes bacterium]|nr:MAG: hypothetical protein D6714_08070 [Bacteroidota bacterium]
MLILGVCPGRGQKILTNDKGEQIRVFPDGRWELVQPDTLAKKQAPAPKLKRKKSKAADRLFSDSPGAAVLPAGAGEPSKPCTLAFDDRDAFTGQKRRDVAAEILFEHTPKAFRPWLGDRQYITCRGWLSQISGGFVFLNLKFEIASPGADKAFGGLPQYAPVVFKLLDGHQVRLLNKKESVGEYDPVRQVFRYEGQFSITRKQARLLRKSPLDRVRIVWGAGYEDYENYEVGFFINQFECLWQ